MPDRYGVIGNPVSHSKSPQIHTAFARQTGHDLVYVRLAAPLHGFRTELDRFFYHGGKGLNVTVPFKQEAAEACQSVSERARDAQAVNTLSFEHGILSGENTDGAGLLCDLEHNLGLKLNGLKVLLLGAGGAARGVIMPLIAKGVRMIVIANRDVAKAAALEERFGVFGNVRARGYAELAGTSYDLVLNCTSASLHHQVPPIPGSVFALGCTAYDMVYATQGNTPFLDMARDCGAARAVDGLGMLVEQAAESFFIWRGVRPDTRPVLDALRAAAL
jgi:shikimate dehydrogenase